MADERMSGLQPTQEDREWYERTKEENRPLGSRAIDAAESFGWGLNGIVQSSATLRTLMQGVGLLGEKIEEGREYAEGVATEESNYGTQQPLYPGATRSGLGLIGEASNQLRQGSEFLRQGATEFAEDRAIPAIEQATGQQVDPRAAGIYGETVGAVPGILTEEAVTLGAGTAVRGLRSINRVGPPPQLNFALNGATNTQQFSRQVMDELTPPTVMKYTDEQLDTLGDVGKNKEFLDTLDPKYRYFTPETLQEAQEQMVKREGPLRTAEARPAYLQKKLDEAKAAGDQRGIDYYQSKLKKAERKVSDFTAGPIEDVVPDNPQTYWSKSKEAEEWRKSAGVDAEGNPRVDSHHQTIESMETAAIFRRMKVVKENPQASLIIWEHMRRLGIVPGPGRRAQRMVSKPEHTLAKDSLHVAVLNKYRGFFKKLPEDISLNDLLGKIDEFAASLDDSDKFYLQKGMPPIDRDIPAGRLMENQTERAIRDVQK